MSTRELFEFVVDPSLAEDQIDEYLEKVLSPLIALVDNDLCCHVSSFQRLLNLQLGSHSSSSTQLSNLFVGAREDHESVIRANC